MKLDDSIVIVSHGEANQTVWRNFTERGQESLGPLLLRESAMKMIRYTPFGERKRWRLSFFQLSYSVQLQNTLPEFTRVLSEKPMESEFTYLCTGISNLPKAITCDGIRHCEHGEDEENCTYRAQGCGDWFPYNDQCLKAIFVPSLNYIPRTAFVTMPVQAEQSCQLDYGATLAILPDSVGVEIVAEMIRKSGFHNAVVGIHKVKPVSLRLRHLYRFLWQWGDQGSPMAYEQQLLQMSGVMFGCAMLNASSHSVLHPLRCEEPRYIPHGYVCMRRNPSHSGNKLKLSVSTFQEHQLPPTYSSQRNVSMVPWCRRFITVSGRNMPRPRTLAGLLTVSSCSSVVSVQPSTTHCSVMERPIVLTAVTN